MRMLATVVVAMLVWGNSAYADNAIDESTIRSWMAHINQHYAGLNVRAKKDLSVPRNRQKAAGDLQNLEDHMQGDIQLDDAALKEILCAHIICGDGDRRLL